ncbi:serine/threonine-protein kinase SBK1-like [Anneissia japonica]|uniref:serine/threonine-protein kinase SBK1-like n=1 Tax=Anneissia japonica TaxID=1529436 RepID=UPI001425A2CE|nr:serine/threonine-protein kinase SBK1-like [Anneissia japonica]XP_033115024.1 serine/threonine-protein kinase SBK1-like [Anneissia japonica]XP_033115025.1 serine/threonine-protein kinase SBK1-like [Anneissia japonica]
MFKKLTESKTNAAATMPAKLPSVSSSAVRFKLDTGTYETERVLGEGTFGRVELVTEKESGTKLALKYILKSKTNFKDFQREFRMSYFLCGHAHVVCTFEAAFETPEAYVFAQEYAPVGDLFDAIPPHKGLLESRAKSCLPQIASAISFLHGQNMVHRDIKPENVLVFDESLTMVKLTDFGMTRKKGSHVRKTAHSIPYTPPEICKAVKHEGYSVELGQDVWSFAVLVFCTLTGSFPWEKADQTDQYFSDFSKWVKRRSHVLPQDWRMFTPRLLKFYRKALDLKTSRRCAITDFFKYVEDDWITPSKRNRSTDEDAGNREAMEDLRRKLRSHGVVTETNKENRKQRTIDWVEQCQVTSPVTSDESKNSNVLKDSDEKNTNDVENGID